MNQAKESAERIVVLCHEIRTEFSRLMRLSHEHGPAVRTAKAEITALHYKLCVASYEPRPQVPAT